MPVMRRAAIVAVLAACGSKQPPRDAIDYSATIDLATLPADLLGLPMTGSVRVEVHLDHARDDLSAASGTIHVECASRCQIGDDHAKFVPQSERARAMIGEGIEFDHLAFDSFAVDIAIDHGTASIAKWNVASPDVQLVASGSMKLARTLADSTIDACVRFAPTVALEQRSPRTAAALSVTGAPRSPKDGLFNIRLADRFADMKRLAHLCDGSPDAPRPTRPALAPPAPQPQPPAGSGVDPAVAVKPSSETAFDLDSKLWAKIVDNPMPFANGARLVPAFKDGKPTGFKIYSIRADSLFAHLGLQDGDVIVTIAGQPLTSADKALEVYSKVHALTVGDHVTVMLERKGSMVAFVYTLR